jgi:hypothetical protein
MLKCWPAERSAVRDGTIRALVDGGASTRRGEKALREEGSPGTEGWRIVVSKTQSLRWLENLKRSQRLTAREERRKEEVMEIFRELYDISLRHQDPSIFPPWRPSW